jgi:hypothetical protein
MVAVLLLALVMTITLPVVARGAWLARMAPEVADLDQRARVIHETLRLAVDEAGAGMAMAGMTPMFAGRAPAVFPALRGVAPGDPPNAAFVDRLTLVSGDVAGWDVALGSPMTTLGSPLFLQPGPPCPVADPRCGFRAGDAAAVGDRLGNLDLLRVTAAAGPVLSYLPPALTRAYQVSEDARVIRVRIRQFRVDLASGQLRVGDGLGYEAPVMDGVTGFACEFYGVAAPPAGVLPPLGTASCLTRADGTPTLPALSGGTGGTVKLPLALFTDGPFCGAGPMAYDADLMRIRRVVVRVSVQDGNALTGPSAWSALAHLGNTREVVVDVAPRNLQ